MQRKRKNDKMKVLHVSNDDSFGAGRAAFRLHCVLRDAGVRSRMLVSNKSVSDGDVEKASKKKGRIKTAIERALGRSIQKNLEKYSSTRPKGAEIFSDDRMAKDIGGNPQVKEADVVQMHWVAGMIDHEGFFSKIGDKPVVWTMHDLNPFTGGCHYPGSCRKYVTECGACPQLGSSDTGDLASRIFQRKRRAYGKRNIHVVAPSRWMAERARESAIFGDKKISVIPNGVSPETFKRINKKAARDLLGLQGKGVVILFGAGDTAAKRKGMALLIEALEKVPKGENTLMVFGRGQKIPEKINEIPVVATGEIKDERMMACVYSASDIFVLPSLEDNLPNTMIEALACGTPVVGFDTGGIPEAIRPGETGVLASTGDSEDLAEKIKWIVSHVEEREKMSQIAVEVARKEYTDKLQAERYIKLYQEIIK